jgi:hypothetical protein
VGTGFNWAQAESQWQCGAVSQFANQHYRNSVVQWIREMSTVHMEYGQAKLLENMNKGWQGNDKSKKTIEVVRLHGYECFGIAFMVFP